MDEHQESNGLLKPPTSQEQTDLNLAGLRTPDAPPEPMPIRRLTLNEADTLRANRAFKAVPTPLPEGFIEELHDHAFMFSQFIIGSCPEGKERSQALGQVDAAVLWAVASLQRK